MKLFELSQLHTSLRFPLENRQEGFAVRGRDGKVRAYLNLCPHRAQPVDVGDGRLFMPDGNLECSAHGAMFDRDSGACIGGPCGGYGLKTLDVEVRDGAVHLCDSGTLTDFGSDDPK